MKKVILGLLTLTLANTAMAAKCPSKVVQAIKQAEDLYYKVPSVMGSVYTKIALDTTRDYSCQKSAQGVVVSNVDNGKEFLIGHIDLQVAGSPRYFITTVTIADDKLLFTLNEANMPWVGVNLKTNALILDNGKQIEVSR